MFGSPSPRLVLAATVVTAACLLAIAPAQPAHAQDFSRPAQSPGTNVDSSDYGAGGHMNATVNQATGELVGQVFDPKNNLRREVKETYSTDGGTKHEAERLIYDFGLKGNLLDKIDYKFDLKGGLSYLDNEHFGLHGERTWEQKTTYRPDGFDTSTWHVGLDYEHAWTKETTTYKPPATTAGQPAKPAIQPLPPSTMQVGVLFPRDFHAGETVTGSLWPATYAEGFKTVPGLSEYSFPIEVAHLPDGTPSWSSLEIGVKNDGYWPVNPNGTFSVHIPGTWTGPLQLQTRDLYTLPGTGPSSALLDIGNPVAAPALPTNLLSANVSGFAKAENLAYLKHLWNLARDLEIDFNEAEDINDDDFYWATRDDLEEYEYYLWNEIDDVIDSLPPADVAQLASDQIKEADERVKTLEDGPQTPDNTAELKDMRGWVDFLEDEADHAHWLAGDFHWIAESPYWTNPILTQGKLGAVRGSFYDDPLDTNLHIGTNTIWPLAGTGSELYFMPPIGLTPGLNNLILDGPAMPPTEMPVFYMTLTMWADQLNLHKGQSTTYYVKLDGLNGLSSSAWSSSFFPSDLVSPSELSGGSGASSAPGNSQSGYITLAVTNESPGTITMKNTFSTLDAKLFAPSGSYQISGGVGAIADGGFNILGVARAYLQPELGFGYPQGSAAPASSGFGGSMWNPSTHLEYKPDSTAGLFSLADCSAGGIACSGYGQPVLSEGPQGSIANATQRVSDAQKKYDAAHVRTLNATDAARTALKTLEKDAPAQSQAYHQAIRAQANAEMDHHDAYDEYNKNPSADTLRKLDEAGVKRAQATKALEAARQDLIDHATPEHQAAWQAANDALKQATYSEMDARDELKAAQDAAAETPNVPPPPQPGTPVPNVHPPQ